MYPRWHLVFTTGKHPRPCRRSQHNESTLKDEKPLDAQPSRGCLTLGRQVAKLDSILRLPVPGLALTSWNDHCLYYRHYHEETLVLVRFQSGSQLFYPHGNMVVRHSIPSLQKTQDWMNPMHNCAGA